MTFDPEPAEDDPCPVCLYEWADHTLVEKDACELHWRASERLSAKSRLSNSSIPLPVVE